MPSRNLTIILLASMISLVCYFKAERSRHAAGIAEAINMVSEYYVDKVDSRKLYEDALAGMVSGLDPYSGYISPEDLNQMNVTLDQEFGGVGVEVEKQQVDDPLTVLSPLFGSPAYRAGILAGDKILAVDGASMIGIHLRDSVKLMRGKPGTEVLLTIERAGQEEPLEVKIVREVIQVDSVLGDVRHADGSWDYRLAEDPRIAYLRVITFGQHTVEEITKVLQSGEREPRVEGILLDLRGNAGGLLDAAVETCDLFVDQGRIVSTNGRDGKLRSSHEATSGMVVPREVPMVILVNQFSASASEIVAACLQDHGRAVVIGERTWGKGTVQNILELEGGRSAIKLTTATYWRPSGQNIHRSETAKDTDGWGVQPNAGFEVQVTDEEAQKIFTQRRERDRNHDTEQAPATPATESASPPTTETPFDDPQLRRAIEYLQQRLGDPNPESQTAVRQLPQSLEFGVKA